MREIKFKYVWQHLDTGALITDVLTVNDIECDGANSIPDEIGRCVFVDRWQFTGLKDKNNVEICEGDVLKHQDFVVQVVYQAPEFVMKIKPSHNTWFRFTLAPDSNQFEEVIGNIYENPKLMKKETQM